MARADDKNDVKAALNSGTFLADFIIFKFVLQSSSLKQVAGNIFLKNCLSFTVAHFYNILPHMQALAVGYLQQGFEGRSPFRNKFPLSLGGEGGYGSEVGKQPYYAALFS